MFNQLSLDFEDLKITSKSDENVIKSGINCNNKQSFDRFGDDLCELIVSYLSISDKMRFECISKQFKRLLFNTQKALIISESDLSANHNSINNTINQLLVKSREYKRLFTIEKRLLSLVLNKFCFVKHLVIDNYCIIDGQVLRAIADNCLHLKSFVCTSIKCLDLSDEELRYFGHKLSKSLHSIQFDCLQDRQLSEVLRLTQNSINSVNVKNNNFIISNDFVFLDFKAPEIRGSLAANQTQISKLCPKLKSIYMTCYSVEDIKRFADYYCLDLTKIEIRFMSNYLMGSVMNSCLKQLSRFVNLQSLTLLIYNYQKGLIAPIDEGLRMIGQNCRKLQYFVLEMTKNLISSPLFDVFREYSTLKELKISTTYETLEGCDYGSIEALKNSKDLIHLTLYLKYISDRHLNNLSLISPKLQTFKVNTTMGLITDKTFELLSKLSSLKIIEISGTSAGLIGISDAGVSRVLTNCPLIRIICLFCRTSVGKPTVDQLIAIAERFPKNSYKYFYELNHEFIDEMSDNMQSSVLPVPKNLAIYQL